MPRLALFLLALSSGSVTTADSPAPPTPRITTSQSGEHIFVSTPNAETPWDTRKAQGVAYHLDSSGNLKESWRIDGWYSFSTFLLNDGRHLVRMGPWNVGYKPEAEDLAIAFYEDGKLIKSYSTVELVKDPSKVHVSSSHYDWLTDWDQTTHAPKLAANDSFTLTTADGIHYKFDARTGNILSATSESERVGDWATITEIDRLCLAVSLMDFPCALAKLDETLGLPKNAHVISEGRGMDRIYLTKALTQPDKGGGRYILDIVIEPPTKAKDMEWVFRPVEGNVIGLTLGYITPDRRKTKADLSELAKWVERIKQEPRGPNDTLRTISERAIRTSNSRAIFTH